MLKRVPETEEALKAEFTTLFRSLAVEVYGIEKPNEGDLISTAENWYEHTRLAALEYIHNFLRPHCVTNWVPGKKQVAREQRYAVWL